MGKLPCENVPCGQYFLNQEPQLIEVVGCAGRQNGGSNSYLLKLSGSDQCSLELEKLSQLVHPSSLPIPDG